MDNQKTHEEAIPLMLYGINAQAINDTGIQTVLKYINSTLITYNYDAIIAALDDLCRRINALKWEEFFQRAIVNVRDQQRVTEKTVKYEGLLTHEELESLIEASHTFLHYGSPAKLSVVPPPKEKSELFLVSISSDSGKYLDNDFGPGGVFQLCHCEWLKKLTRIPALPQPQTEKTNSVTLPSGDILSFRDERWWITRSRGGGIEECLRSEAHNLLRQGCLVNCVTDEAWADVIKPGQPFL